MFHSPSLYLSHSHLHCCLLPLSLSRPFMKWTATNVTTNVTLINFNFVHFICPICCTSSLSHIFHSETSISFMCSQSPNVLQQPWQYSWGSFRSAFPSASICLMNFFSDIFCRYFHSSFLHPTLNFFSHFILIAMLCYVLLSFPFYRWGNWTCWIESTKTPTL